MRKLVLLLAVLEFSGSAYAADMAVKAPPAPMVVPSSWAGFYVGGNVGGVWGRDTGTTNFFDAFGFDAAPPVPNSTPQSDSISTSSVIGGIQAGYNWQVKQWVFGVEADW